ncbi:MAG: hypothetical protein JWO67_4582 [Streptosporangiaceae bacterium]|nr:hypothetical protein [Streptosporangiaceae bacterium]
MARSTWATLASPLFDGDPRALDGVDTAIAGRRTFIKLQHRRHEGLGTVLRFEELRRRAGTPAPRLLDHGTVEVGSDEIWWAVLQRLGGRPSDDPLAWAMSR